MVSPVTVLANMIMIPLTSFITACGFALVIAGKILPFLGQLFAGSCALAILGLLKVNSILVQLKGAYGYIRPLPIYFIFGYYLLMAAVVGGLAFLARFLKPGPANEFDTFGAPK